MGKPSRTRDLMGAVLLVLVGILYMSGVSDVTVEVGSTESAAPGVVEVSAPVQAQAAPAFRS